MSVRGTSMGGFRFEADMLGPIAAAADLFLQDGTVLYEVACAGGVPDVVLLDLDYNAGLERGGRAPLQHAVDVLVMLALQASPALPVAPAEVAVVCHVSSDHLRRGVLPRLVDGGHLHAGWQQDGLRATYEFRSLARRVVTLEAKLRDWRGGLAQATRHTGIADEAWLVLDRTSVHRASAHENYFRIYDVGLASLDSDGKLLRLIEPGVNRSRQPARELLVERAVGLLQAGRTSGPLLRVFGQVLVASNGNDPRLPRA